MHENPHDTTDPKGLRHEVGNVPVPQSVQRNGPIGISRLRASLSACKGSTDTPREATFGTGTTLKLGNGILQNRLDRKG